MRTKHTATVICTSLITIMLFAGTAFAAPKINSPEPIYNFGERPNTETVPHEFVIKNEGDETLEISDVKTSCGCTVAVPEKKTLLAGEETKITATLKLSGEGPRTKEITVFSNDPATPQYILKYEGSAVAAIKYEPQTLDFSQIMDEETHELKLKIYTEMPDMTFKITNLNLNQDYLEASYVAQEDGKSYEITVKNNKPFPNGRIAGMLIIETDHPTSKEFRVYITGQVMGDYWVQPDVLRLRYEDTGRMMNGFLRVSPGRIKEFKLVDSVKPIDTMTVEFEQQGAAYLVRLQNMPVDDTLNDKQLILKTDIPGHEEIVVPISVMKQQSPVPAPQNPAGQPVTLPVPAPAVPATPAPAAPAPAPGK